MNLFIFFVIGAAVDYPNSLTGSTALHEAVSCSKDFLTFQEIFFCLQNYHVNINTICFSGGDTPLFRAILLERYKSIYYLLLSLNMDLKPFCLFLEMKLQNF